MNKYLFFGVVVASIFMLVLGGSLLGVENKSTKLTAAEKKNYKLAGNVMIGVGSLGVLSALVYWFWSRRNSKVVRI